MLHYEYMETGEGQPQPRRSALKRIGAGILGIGALIGIDKLSRSKAADQTVGKAIDRELQARDKDAATRVAEMQKRDRNVETQKPPPATPTPKGK